MLGANILLPFITMFVGALFEMLVNGGHGWMGGAVAGFGVGCAILALVWLLFALLKRWVE
jgi:hypothetical protein